MGNKQPVVNVKVKFTSDSTQLHNARRDVKRMTDTMGVSLKGVRFNWSQATNGVVSFSGATKASIPKIQAATQAVMRLRNAQSGGFATMNRSISGQRNLTDVIKGTGRSLDDLSGKQNLALQRNKQGAVAILKWAIGWQIAYGALNALKQGIAGSISTFGELEMALIRIRLASGESSYELKNFTDQVFKVAAASGQSAREVAEASKIWAQQGKSVAESLRLTEAASMAANITGQDLKTTISSMTGIMNAWNIEAENMGFVMDKFAKVADNYAITTDVLSDAFLRVGVTAADAGVKFNDLIGIITAVHQTTRRSGTEIGTAFRTIFTRYLREDTIKTTQEIAKIPMFMNSMGEATFRNTGKIRDFSTVMRELDVSLKGLSDTERGKVLEKLTGVRRVEQAKALFGDLKTAIEASALASNAFGYSAKVNEKIMESFQKQVAQLSVEGQKFGQALGNVLVPALEGLVSSLKSLTKATTILLEHKVAVSAALTSLTVLILAVMDANYKLAFSFKAVGLSFVKFGKLLRLHTIVSLKHYIAMSKQGILSTRLFALGLGSIGIAAFGAFAAISWMTNELNKLNDAYAETQRATSDMFSLWRERAKDKTDVQIEFAIAKQKELIELAKKTGVSSGIQEHVSRLQFLEAELKMRKEGKNVIADATHQTKLKMLLMERELALLKISGKTDYEIAVLRLDMTRKINDGYIDEIELLKLQTSILTAYKTELMSLKQTFQDVVSDGLNKLIEGTGTLQDMLVGLSSAIRKHLIEGFLGEIERKFNIFGQASEMLTSPFAQAHLAGIEAGTEILKEGAFDAIKKGADYLKQSIEEGFINTREDEASSLMPGMSTPGSIEWLLGKSTSQAANDNAKLTRIKELEYRKKNLEDLIGNGYNETPYTYLGPGKGLGPMDPQQEGALLQGIHEQHTELQGIYSTLDALKKETEVQTDLQETMGEGIAVIPSTLKDSLSSLMSIFTGGGAKGGGGGGPMGAIGGMLSPLLSIFGGKKKGATVEGGASGEQAQKGAAGFGIGSLLNNAVSGGIAGFGSSGGTMKGGAGGAIGGMIGGIAQMAMMATPLAPIAPLMPLLGGFIGGLFGKKKKEPGLPPQVREQTHQITSRINHTNKTLEIINRNLVGIKRGFEGWVMQESYYLRQRSRGGVNVQNEMALNMGRGYSN